LPESETLPYLELREPREAHGERATRMAEGENEKEDEKEDGR